ncbi:hypothetical protein C2857_005749 [Epichloe festucae Fl1]|uniref:Pheromone receptor n=1 Tax=Epichloe festucae (strain Fl1) TaxID=877507 RepID=A0A7S9KT09_EPIFF|nr:hypothetical protein C2857_005749 [Epichloe festucae Fl1]
MDSSSLTHWYDTRGTTTIVATVEPLSPYTDPALTANLVCRVLLAIVANLTCLVPLRLLYRNGELAAVVFILNVEIKNLETITNALIWRNDNIRSWWAGYGWCDVDAYIHNISIGLFVTCLLAIIRNLAQQVGLMRANALSVQERRRRNLIQALIIFPFPIIQLCLTWPLTAQRYLVGTLIGCNWIAHPSWPFLVFFVLPPPIFALITSAYAVLIYKRFRQVTKTTETALLSNRIAQQRSQRTRRRLYLMVISILIPFLPVVLALAAFNISQMQGLKPYNYDQVHNHASPLPWDTILFVSSGQINWAVMNNCYISIATAIPIFVFFGLTKDAVNNYRQVALFFGLGTLFPRLRREYDPDKAVSVGGSSFGSSQMRSVASAPSKTESLSSPGPSSRHMSFRIDSTHGQPSQHLGVHDTIHAESTTTTRFPGHNPLLFSTRRNISVPHFLRNCFVRKKKPGHDPEIGPCLGPVQPACPLGQSYQISGRPSVQTVVWSGEGQEGSGSVGCSGIARKPVACGVQVQTCLSRET